MIRINLNGQDGYFITQDQKEKLDKILKPLLSSNCGEDCNATNEKLS